VTALTPSIVAALSRSSPRHVSPRRQIEIKCSRPVGKIDPCTSINAHFVTSSCHQSNQPVSRFIESGAPANPSGFLVGERADIAGVDLEQVFRGSLAGFRDGTHSEFAWRGAHVPTGTVRGCGPWRWDWWQPGGSAHGAIRATDSRRGAAVDWGLLRQRRLHAQQERDCEREGCASGAARRTTWHSDRFGHGRYGNGSSTQARNG